jgi:hypothetical protein
VLRHTFGSHLADAGEDGHRIQKALGHANLTTTEIYTRGAALDSVDTARRLAEHRAQNARKRIGNKSSATQELRERYEGKVVGAVGIEPTQPHNTQAGDDPQET